MNRLIVTGGLLGLLCLIAACQQNPAWEAGIQRAEALAEMEPGTVSPDRVEEVASEPQPLTRIWVFPIGGVGEVGDSELDGRLGDLLADLQHWQYIERIEVIGHTDDQGTEEYNQRLSVARADRVAERLIIAGFDQELIAHRGLGETRPVADNDSPAGRADNRRVEIRVTGLGPWPEDAGLALLPKE